MHKRALRTEVRNRTKSLKQAIRKRVRDRKEPDKWVVGEKELRNEGEWCIEPERSAACQPVADSDSDGTHAEYLIP